MNRWLLIGSLAGLMFAFTGCATCSNSGGCSSGGCGSIAGSSSCSTGNCSTGGCKSGGFAMGGCKNGSCGGGCGPGSGGMGALAGMMGCNACGGSGCGRPGCMTGPIGWQSGGLDYSSHLQTGLLGHNAAANLNSRPFTPGPPTGQVGYPYYTVRGPRDFLQDNPPTIGR